MVARADGPATLTIDLTNSGPAISPTLFGLMTEEINHSYEGGLFAELIQNRTFQDPKSPQDPPPQAGSVPIHWSTVGSGKISIDSSSPLNTALPLSLRLDLSGDMGGAANDGYWGIPIWPDTTYTASFYAKAGDGFSGPVTASLLTDERGVTVAKADTTPLTGEWKKYTVTLTTGHDAATTAKARFVLSANGSGSIDFSLVSLFPPTYQNTRNGLRPDLMKMMADMHPSFIRLPGGNYLEGNRFSDRFNWKQTIGPVEERPGHMGCWSYRSDDGFGLPQYLLWCKQLGAEPVLAVFAGYCLNGDHFDAGSKELAIYTQEALEEIEYVSGPADSEWGKRRVADGFAEPFPLHYVEIGNEDFFDRSPSYDGRFTEIAKAIREKYPKLKLIATAPVKSTKPDLYDDHFYPQPQELIGQWNLYDKGAGNEKSDRRDEGTQTFVGEWAAQEGHPTTDLNAGLADAIWLMGLEHDSDTVPIECFAPLFANVNLEDKAKGYPRGWQWETNLIGYDALHSYGSPSYYAQVMFGQNKGDVVLPAKLDFGQPADTADATPHGAVGVGTWHTQVDYKDIVVTAPDGHKLSSDDLFKDAKAWQFTGGDWDVGTESISQHGEGLQSWAVAGDATWTDYTLQLKARKVGGEEGFLVLWHAADGDNYRWWNIGGWANTQIRCEATTKGIKNDYGPGGPFTIQTGRWYDIRIEVKGGRMRGFIDGKLVTSAAEPPHPPAKPVYASATYNTAAHTVIVKAVNAGADPVDVQIGLQGAKNVNASGTAIVLSGSDPKATNTIDQPTNVTPKEEALANVSAAFTRTLPPYSFTLLKLQTDAPSTQK